jgi:predicted transcriptional regulator
LSEQEILSILLASEIRGDLLVLFHRNPGLIDTVDGIARRIGRTTISVTSDVRELLQLGLLRQKRIGASEVVYLDRARDRQILESVANHLKTVRISGEK